MGFDEVGEATTTHGFHVSSFPGIVPARVVRLLFSGEQHRPAVRAAGFQPSVLCVGRAVRCRDDGRADGGELRARAGDRRLRGTEMAGEDASGRWRHGGSGGACRVQVSRVPGREPVACSEDRRTWVRGAEDRAADRHLVLRVPDHLVHRGRLSRHRRGAAQPVQVHAVRQPLPAADRRPDRPLRHDRAGPREPHGELREHHRGHPPLRAWTCEEGACGGRDGVDGGRDLRRARGVDPVLLLLVRRGRLHDPDLFRLLGVFRHGHRPRADVQLPLPRELRPPVRLVFHPGVLAAVAAPT